MPEVGDAERLVVLLEARIRDFEKNMSKASGTATRNYGAMRRGSQSATRQMETDMVRSTSRINQALATTSTSVGAFGRSFTAGAIAPIAGLLSLTAAVRGTKAALDKFGDINDKSIAAGLDPEFFQGLAYQARMAGVEVDGTASALATYAKNSGLAAEGKGRMVSTLKALNPELLRSIQLASSQEERVRLAADAIKNAKDQAQAAALASAMFGDQGVKLVATFRQGADEIDRMVVKAKEMGVVVDRDLIANADELGDRWDTMATIIDTKVKTALVNLAPVIVNLTDLATRLMNVLGDQIAGKKPMNIPNWGAGGIGTQMNQHLSEVLRGYAYPETAVAGLPRRYSESQYAFGDMGDFFNTTTDDAVARMRASMDTGGGSATGPFSASSFDFRSLLDGKGAGKVDAVATSFEHVGNAAKESAVEIAGNSEAVMELQTQMETYEGMASSFVSTFISDMRQGRNAIDSIAEGLGNLGEQLLQMAADQAIKALFSSLLGAVTGSMGGSMGGSLMGGVMGNGLWGSAIFGGMRADGGPVEAGKAYVVGERRPELFVPSVPGHIEASASASPNGSTPSVSFHVAVDARGAQAGVGAEIARALAAFSRHELPGRLAEIQRNPTKR